jgi:hypothetical protein
MLHCGDQMQGTKSSCLICLLKDTYSQRIPLICLVCTDGCQMLYGKMSAASCTEALHTNNLMQPMMCLSIAATVQLPCRWEEGPEKQSRRCLLLLPDSEQPEPVAERATAPLPRSLR